MMKKLGIKRANSKGYPAHGQPDSPHAIPYPDTHSFNGGDRQEVVSERPVLTPDVLFELRRACAVILKETGPSDEDYEAILNQPDPLEQYTQEYYTQEQKEIRNVREQASASQTSLPWSTPGRKRDSKHLREDSKAANRLSGRAKAKDEQQHAAKRHHSKPLPPVKGVADEHYHPMPKPVTGPLPPSQQRSKPPRQSAPARAEQRANSSKPRHEHRPRTASATETSVSTVASEAPPKSKPNRPELEGHRMKSNASHASRAPIPAEEIHPALRRNGPRRDHETQEKRASRGHDYDLRNDREKRISQVNPDYTHIPTLHPTVYRPPQPYQPAPRPYSRPQSRAGEILDNLRDGIRNYVQPRPSLASTRFGSRDVSRNQSRADSRSGSRSSSRPASRGSLFGSSNRQWFGLRRKNSWSSFRSAGEDEEMDQGRGRDKGPDLNRSLPPLPGLDQYKEPKMHIAMLARANYSVGNTSPTQPAGGDPQSMGMTGLRPQEIHVDARSPDIGPTPPAKSNPRSPPERRLTKRPPNERKKSSNEGKKSSGEGKKHIASEMTPKPEKKEKKEWKKSISEKKEKKNSLTEKKSPTPKSPEVKSPMLNQSVFDRPRPRAEPSPFQTSPPAHATEWSPQKSPPHAQPQPLNLTSPKQASAEKKSPEANGPTPAPVRSASDASMVRIPFSDDDDSVPASRVISMGPGFLDMEVQRRLKDGKISTLNPTSEALEAAQKPSQTPQISHTPESKEVPLMLDTEPRPPMPLPAPIPTGSDDVASRKSPSVEPGSRTKLHLQRPTLGDRGDSSQTQASEARSLAALGVDRVDRDHPPVPAKSPRMLAVNVPPGERRRAASALGHYEGQRQALQPRESLLLGREGMRTREIVGAGALVGLEGLKSPPAPVQPPPSAATVPQAPGTGSSGVVSPTSPQKWSGPDFSSPRRDTFRERDLHSENQTRDLARHSYESMRSGRMHARERSYDSSDVRSARSPQDRERLMRAISYEHEWHLTQQQQKQQQQHLVLETKRSMTMPNGVAEAMLGKLRPSVEQKRQQQQEQEQRPRKGLRNRLSRLLGGRGGERGHQPLVTAS